MRLVAAMIRNLCALSPFNRQLHASIYTVLISKRDYTPLKGSCNLHNVIYWICVILPEMRCDREMEKTNGKLINYKEH